MIGSSCPAGGWELEELSSSSISPRLSCTEPREWKNEEPEMDEEDLPSVEIVSDSEEELLEGVGGMEDEEKATTGKWAWFGVPKRQEGALKTIVGMNRKEYEKMAAEAGSEVPYRWMKGVYMAPRAVRRVSVATPPPSSAPESDEDFCSICWAPYTDEASGSSTRLYLNCGHEFCQACVRTTALSASNVLRIVCPDRNCEVTLDDDLLTRLLPAKEFAKLERMRHKAAMNRNPNLRYCPEPKCSAMVLTAGPLQPQAKCPECSLEFCFFCLQKWHGVTKTCQEYAEELKEAGGSDANEVLVMNDWLAENAHVKKCPACLTPIMKNGGCRHMTCSSCAFEFCWRCLDSWKNKTHYRCENRYVDAFGQKAVMPSRITTYQCEDIYYPRTRTPAAIEETVKRLEKKKESRETRNAGKKVRTGFLKRLRKPFRLDIHGFVERRERPSAHFETEFKIVLAGESGSGKSCLVKRFCQNFFDDAWDFDIEDSYRKQVGGALMEILDMTGQEEFSCLAEQGYRTGEAFLVTFRPDSNGSLAAAKTAMEIILRVKDEAKEEAAFVLVGTMADTYPQGVPESVAGDARDVANEFACPLIYTSALDGFNVDGAFMELLQQARRRRLSSSLKS